MNGSIRQRCGILLLGFVFLVAACGGGDNPLAETAWRLVELGDAAGPDAVVAGDPDVRFSADEIDGWTGCNSYGGEYSVRGDELRLTELWWTEAGCLVDAMFWQERRMLDLLASIEGFEVASDRLTLHSEGGQVLVFERTSK